MTLPSEKPETSGSSPTPSDATLQRKPLEEIDARRSAPEAEQQKTTAEDGTAGPEARLVASYSYRGPLPPPEQLAYYDETLPGAADRVFLGWEEERRHRHAVELRALEEAGDARRADDRFKRRGQLGALVTVIVFGAVATTAILTGHAAEGAVIAGTTAASIAGAFLGKQLLQRSASDRSPRSPEDEKIG